jgi:hypothetical protein
MRAVSFGGSLNGWCWPQPGGFVNDEIARGALHQVPGAIELFPELAQLGQFILVNFAVEILFDVVDEAPQLPHRLARRPRQLRQTLRSQHDQGDEADHHQFRETDVEHRARPWPRIGSGFFLLWKSRRQSHYRIPVTCGLCLCRFSSWPLRLLH